MNSEVIQPKTRSNTGVIIFVGFLGVSSVFDLAAWIVRSGFHSATPLTLVLHLFDLFIAVGSLLVVLSSHKPNIESIINIFFGVFFIRFVVKTLINHNYWLLTASVFIVVIAWLISRSRDSNALNTPCA